MSSNIRILKVCEFCGQEFIAKTTVTRYCSHLCNQRHYKKLIQIEKVGIYSKNIISTNRKTKENANCLTIPEAARFLQISERTLFRLMAQEKIIPNRIGRNVFLSKNQLKQSL